VHPAWAQELTLTNARIFIGNDAKGQSAAPRLEAGFTTWAWNCARWMACFRLATS
jgi:hypothetical protein